MEEEEVLDSRGRNVTLIIFGVIALLIIGLVWNNYRTKAGWIADMKSNDPGRQKAAAEAMMKRGQIAEQLQGQKPSVRVAAVQSLAQVKTPEAADQLFQFMKDGDSPIKDLAVRSLTALGPEVLLNPNDSRKDALHPGIDALSNSDDAVKGGGVSVLTNFHDVVLQPDPQDKVNGLPLSELLLNNDARNSAADVLVKLGKGEDGRKRDPMKVVSLVVPYRDPKYVPIKIHADAHMEDVQLKVVDILDRIPEPRSVPYLIEMLSYPHTQRAAVGALGRKGDKRATPYLLKVLAQNELIPEETVVALGQIGDPSAVPKLVTEMGSFSEKVRMASAEALRRIGVASVPALLAAAKSPDSLVRIGAARALGGLRDPEGKAVAMSVALLNDKDANVRVAAAQALGQLPDAKTVPALVAKFDDPDGRVGDEAAVTVSRVGKPAVPALISLLKAAPGSGKVYFASKALQFIGHDAVTPLIAALHSPDPAVAQGAAKLLGDLGDPEALSALRLAAQKNASPDVRWAAARSVVRLGGESPSAGAS